LGTSPLKTRVLTKVSKFLWRLPGFLQGKPLKGTKEKPKGFRKAQNKEYFKRKVPLKKTKDHRKKAHKPAQTGSLIFLAQTFFRKKWRPFCPPEVIL
jgi:hypothetical protein